jgi:D-alanyl-D-alanine carboxypeptidase
VGDPASSVVVSVKALKDNGTASVVVENEELQGREAFLVLLSASGELVAAAKTMIGGG